MALVARGNYKLRKPHAPTGEKWRTKRKRAVLGHIIGGHVETIDAGPRSYQPMNVNFGLFAPLAAALDERDENGKRLRGTAKALARKRALCRRALGDLARWAAGSQHSVAAE